MQLSKTVFEISNPKSGTAHKVDLAQWKPEGVAYIIEYGLKQQNDCHSQLVLKGKPEGQHKKIKADADKALTDRLDNLAKGILPKGGGGGSRIPVEILYFAQVVHKLLGDGIEGTAKKTASSLVKGEVTKYKLGMAVAVRHKGKKANKELAKKAVEAIEAKVQARIAEEAARERADAEALAGLFSDDEPTIGEEAGEVVA